MTKRVPFPFVRGLDDRPARELERNFQYLTDQLTSTVTGWDAIVDPTIAADNTAALQFKTVFAAIKYLADTLGNTDQTIGLRNTNTTTSEVGIYGGTTSGLTVRVIGIGSTAVSWVNPVTSPLVPTWDLAGFTENGKFTRLILAGIRFAKKEGPVVPAAAWFSGTPTVYANGVYFDGQGASGTGAQTCNLPGGNYINCSFADVAFNGAVAAIGCQILYNRPTTTVTNAGDVLWLDCVLTTNGNSVTMAFTSTNYVILDGTTAPVTGGSPVMTVTISVARRVSIREHTPQSAGRAFIVNVTSPNLISVVLEGMFEEVTVPALAASAGSQPHRIHGIIKNRFDITGPANIAIAAHDGSAPTTYVGRFRGSGINGSVTAWVADSASAATVLDFIAAKRCVISASVVLVGAASTGTKTYNFDATSANNILVLETDTLGAASADAGANDLVITDATFGSSPTQPTIDADFSHDFMMGTL